MSEERKYIVWAEESEEHSADFSHPWNPNSKIRGMRFSSLVGLSRLGLWRVRVPPGKESFVYHSHQKEEEWLFILEGRGLVEISDEEHEVEPGDFIGFPAPQLPHHLKNASESEDLIYLMGGEALDMDIADFPRLGKRMVRSGSEVQIYDHSDAKEFGSLEET
jgi:uncharacterized cupin superfamily protein